MGTIVKGILGGFSGKVGTVVGSNANLELEDGVVSNVVINPGGVLTRLSSSALLNVTAGAGSIVPTYLVEGRA